jgi:hypothetical protein
MWQTRQTIHGRAWPALAAVLLAMASVGCEAEDGGSPDARLDGRGDTAADSPVDAGIEGPVDMPRADADGGGDAAAEVVSEAPADRGDGPGDAGGDADGGTGQVGEECGDPGQPMCASGLVCCYPCGIAGCHNRCMAPCMQSPCAGACPLFP